MLLSNTSRAIRELFYLNTRNRTSEVLNRFVNNHCLTWNLQSQMIRSQPAIFACFYHQHNNKSRLISRVSSSTAINIHKTKFDGRARIDETKKKVQQAKQVVKERLEGIKENVYTIPNALCVIRIALTPVLAYFVVSSQFGVGLSIFAFAGLTDLLDGYIARNFPNQRSMAGSFLDPFADKLLVATLFLTLTYVQLIPVPLTALIIARDVILVIAGFVIRYLSLPPPKMFSRYFDITMATAQLSPTYISKVNTAVQLLMVSAALAAPVFNFTSHPLLEGLWYVTAMTTVASGISYIVSRNTVKFIRFKKKNL